MADDDSRLSKGNFNSGGVRFEVSNVSTLTEDDRISAEFEAGGVTWIATLLKVNTGDADFLRVSLCSKHSSKNWNIVKYQFNVVNADQYKTVAADNCQQPYILPHDNTVMYVNILEWEMLIDEKEGFITDDKITVEVRLHVFKRMRLAPRIDFTDENWPYRDIVLDVEGQKIYANKGILAINSDYFNTLFYGDYKENNMKEIKLGGVKREDFLEMLNAIYPTPYSAPPLNVDSKSLESLLYLGDMYDIMSLVDRVEEFRINQLDSSHSGQDSDGKFNLANILDVLIPPTSDSDLQGPPNKKAKIDEGAMNNATIVFEVEDISSMNADSDRYSPGVEVGKVCWQTIVSRRPVGLFVMLQCFHDQLSPWSIDVEAKLTLVNSDINKNIYIEKSGSVGHENRNLFSLRGEETWKHLVDVRKGFVKDGNLKIEVKFSISNMSGIKRIPRIDFFDSTDPRHDIALVIGGERIYANKAMLALHSPVFQAMFYGDFAEINKKEIELKDVNREDFLEVLYAIYPSNKKITNETAERLLILGDRFQFEYVMERVENFLIDSLYVHGGENLRMADEYNLPGALQFAILALNTKFDFQELEESSIYGSLSDETKSLLFQRKMNQVDRFHVAVKLDLFNFNLKTVKY